MNEASDNFMTNDNGRTCFPECLDAPMDYPSGTSSASAPGLLSPSTPSGHPRPPRSSGARWMVQPRKGRSKVQVNASNGALISGRPYRGR